MATEEKLKYLEFIQNTISRMNKNSFQIKGCMVTIVAALLALCANSVNILYVYISIFPTIMFWVLDAYYLKQERKFRELFNEAVKDKTKPFSMNTRKYKVCYCKAFFSKTLLFFYLPTILVLTLIVVLYIFYH